MRVPITRDVESVALATQLGAELGRPVALSVRAPGQQDEDGRSLPGVVVLLDPVTGDPLPDQDAKKVKRVVDGHVNADPDDELSPAEKLAVKLPGVTTVAQLRDALVGYAAPQAERDRKARTARRDARGRPRR